MGVGYLIPLIFFENSNLKSQSSFYRWGDGGTDIKQAAQGHTGSLAKLGREARSPTWVLCSARQAMPMLSYVMPVQCTMIRKSSIFFLLIEIGSHKNGFNIYNFCIISPFITFKLSSKSFQGEKLWWHFRCTKSFCSPRPPILLLPCNMNPQAPCCLHTDTTFLNQPFWPTL